MNNRFGEYRYKWNQEEKYLEYRKKWEIYPKLKIVDKVPLNLDLELTNLCNLNCTMCFRSFEKIEPASMPLELAKKVITEFAEKGGYAIKFVYRGEALLYKDLSEIIRFAKEKGIVDTIINTNGTLLNDGMAQNLINAGLDQLNFSVDSCKSQIYSEIRRGGELSMVVRNIFNLIVKKHELNKTNPRTRIQFVIQEKNKNEIAQFKMYWNGLVDEVLINPVCMDYSITKPIKPTPEFFCADVFRRMCVRADGLVQLCCGSITDDKILGDVRKDSLESIWMGSDFVEIRRLMTMGKAHLLSPCNKCDLRNKYELTNFKKSEWQ